ncbi:hypothetical protein McanMca71_004059 [Microsporum canis]
MSELQQSSKSENQHAQSEPYIPPWSGSANPTQHAPINNAVPAHAEQESTGVKKSPSPVPQPVAPTPVEEYLAQANLQPETANIQQPLLVILDMNGTLIYRKRRTFPPKFTKRPGLDPFLRYLFDNFKVMIWTSSQPQTVTDVLDKLLSKQMKKQLVGVWSRRDLDLTARQYREKVQVYKRLDKVWENAHVQSQYPRLTAKTNIKSKKGKKKKLPQILGEEGQVWDQTNTILVDDSRLKAAAQPHNIIEIPEFTDDPDVDEVKNLTIVMRQLDILSRHKDVSRKLREWNQRILDEAGDITQIDAFWEQELVLSSLDVHALESAPLREEDTTARPETPPFLSVEQLINAARKSLETDSNSAKNKQLDQSMDAAGPTLTRASVHGPKELKDDKPKLTKGQKRAAKRVAAKLRAAESATRADPSTVLPLTDLPEMQALRHLEQNDMGNDTGSESDTSIGGGVALPMGKP